MSLLIMLPFDILLIVAALMAYVNRPRIGGQLAKGLKLLLIGVLVVGCCHFIETLLSGLFNLDRVLNEIVHRLLVAFAYIFIILGFVTIRRAFED